MPTPLNYGTAVSLGVTRYGSDDLVLSALNTFLKDEHSENQKDPNPSDYTRTVACCPPAFADSYQWTILDPQNFSSQGRVKFGDTVTLSVNQAHSSAYLSARDDHTLLNNSDRRVGVVPVAAPWEQWKIINPTNTNSTAEVNVGDTCAFLSPFQEYLSLHADNIVAGSTTLGAGEKWRLAPAKAVYLRYGVMVTIDSLGDASHSKSVVSATTYQSPDAADTFRVTFGPHDRGEQRWLVRKFDDRESHGRMKFGDTVLLTLDASTEVPLHLSCQQNVGADGDSKRVVSGVNSLAWECWKVLDPNDSTSQREIKVGDQLVLSNLDYVLSSGQVSATNSAITARPRGSGQVGDTERWVFTPVMPPDASTDSVDTKSLKGLPATDYGVALLKVSDSIQRKLSMGLMKAAASKAGVGELADFAFDEFWPEDAPDIWALIKDKVIALVDDKISEEKFNDFAGELENVKDAISKYVSTADTTDKGQLMNTALRKLDDARTKCEALGKPQYSLPHLVALGTLHLIALRERYARGQQLWPEQPKADRTLHLTDLQHKLAYYQKKVSEAVEAATSWRASFINVTDTPLASTISDSYEPDHLDTTVSSDKNRGWWYIHYSSVMMSMYGQLLDVYRLQSNLWRYLDPSCNEVPVKGSAIMTTGRFGKAVGAAFLARPQVNQPITRILLQQKDQYRCVCGLEIQYADNKPGWQGVKGLQVYHYDMRPGEKIVEVQGKNGDFLTYLCFITNRGQRLEAGDPSSGYPLWVSKPLDGTNAQLVAVSTWGSDVTLDPARYSRESVNTWGMYLHWQYDRWL